MQKYCKKKEIKKWRKSFAAGLFSLSQILVPLLSNPENHKKWPNVVSNDIMRHVGGLKGDVYVLSGQVKGRTLLPIPSQAEAIVNATDFHLQ